MTTPARVRHAAWRLAAVLLVVAAACRPAGRGIAQPGADAGSAAVDVASFNFAESVVVAEIYAQALERAGIPVRRDLDLGPRELVRPALDQGFVDLVPEYLGTALTSVDPAGPAPADAAAARNRLQAALDPGRFRVLEPAPAQDQNGLVVTAARAGQLGLRTTSDLRPVAPGLVLGGPPECPTRPLCLLGLQAVYGLRFARFVPLGDLAQEKTALDEGVIDVAVMFTTDGRLADPDLRLLDDDRHLQPPENVVPVVSSRAVARYGDRLVAALDAVSTQLTSAGLTFLNWRVDVAGKRPDAEAAGWLARHPPAP